MRLSLLNLLKLPRLYERRSVRTGPGRRTWYTEHKNIGANKYTPRDCPGFGTSRVKQANGGR
ncbi:hypothetical protein LCGC14_1692670 [marine sediment metagenome]|uniref:Uncharacterized protein n=1 Tax=marine sediment metagenome TaxID=412755 RepID=A0A0F9HKS1_9ZZZZ